MVNANCNIESNHSCDHLQNSNSSHINSHVLSWEALLNLVEACVSPRIIEGDQPDIFETEWFETSLDAIEKVGNEVLSLEQVAQLSIWDPGLRECMCIYIYSSTYNGSIYTYAYCTTHLYDI